ncbi:ABC-type lipoprotein release transport system permease subunit [Parabacteroides sp. PH5-13]|nr:ABC-type lipoprotein release transport system permease subunit [Parabacteroides sp. PH5-39]MDH6320130.1 ABC-type lipoprotein release transport system permease subunit [Parabacteroides sp. PH5-13]MDH6323927.1 ABC-type lipoprotein release transport system permease subunit [Parabacteroides sp. PH5-8]MDH6385039.1 ABC-type lipoprotein release transport system permease subunit [Parabacteroides sp. PH5-17]MDH6394327.1 ABC-type lipoprotein release transport system permease subunit [Parabacteroides s
MIKIKYIINNIGRKKKQSIFFISTILMSSVIILSDYSLVNGIKNKLYIGINETISGQFVIFNSEDMKMNILESELNKQRITEITDDNINKLKTICSNAHINRRIRLGALVSFNEGTSYTNFHALEDDHLQRIAGMLDVFQGNMPGSANEVLISESLAKDLHCGVGDTLLLLADNVNDYMSDALGVVSGVFKEEGLAIFLSRNGFMPYRLGQEIVEVEDEQVLELIVNPLADSGFTPQEVSSLADWCMEQDPALRLASWEQTVPLMSAIVKVWGAGGVLTQVVFISFSLIILLTLASLVVRSRMKEIGTLLAIGFSWLKIRILLCAEYLIMTFFAVAIAYLLLLTLQSLLPVEGFAIESEYMQAALMTDRLPPCLYFRDFLQVLLLFTATAVLAVLISVGKLRKKRVYSLVNN